MHEPTATPLARTRSQLSADFRDLDQLYSDLYNRCSREQLLWQPPDGSWSIARCIEHVALSISQYLVPIQAAIAKGGPNPPGGEYLLSPGGLFSAAFLKRIGPHVARKFQAPRKIQPSSADPEPVFDDLRRGHAEIQKLLATPNLPDFNQIRFRNPFIAVLRFTVASGFLILAAHGRRHLLQAERVSNRADFPKSKAQQSA